MRMRPVDHYRKAFDLRATKIAYQSTLVEQANWKLVVENARECYHCATGHPELKLSFPVTINAGFDFGVNAHIEAFLARASTLNLPVAPREGEWWSVGRYPLNPGMESISRDGKAVVSRRITHIQEPGIGGVRWATEPNNFCHVLPDYAFMFSAIPIGTQETLVISKWLVHKDAVEGVDYRVDELIETWTTTNLQDRELAENNQRGVNGLGYSPGGYSEDAEDFVIRFTNRYRAAARSAINVVE
jgi:glycine betaine catabolism A